MELHFIETGVLAALVELGVITPLGWICDGMICENFEHDVLGTDSKDGRYAESIKNFRLISLVGSLYKLLSKVLANRLKKVRQFEI